MRRQALSPGSVRSRVYRLNFFSRPENGHDIELAAKRSLHDVTFDTDAAYSVLND